MVGMEEERGEWDECRWGDRNWGEMGNEMVLEFEKGSRGWDSEEDEGVEGGGIVWSEGVGDKLMGRRGRERVIVRSWIKREMRVKFVFLFEGMKGCWVWEDRE